MQRLNPIALGLALGVLWGVWLLVSALANMLTGHYAAQWILTLSSLYPGFSGTALGALIGLGWGVGDGFVAGALVAWIYNSLLRPAPVAQSPQ